MVLSGDAACIHTYFTPQVHVTVPLLYPFLALCVAVRALTRCRLAVDTTPVCRGECSFFIGFCSHHKRYIYIKTPSVVLHSLYLVVVDNY